MKLLYVHDNIYQQCPDGFVYSPGQFPYVYWRKFLKHFDHINVVGRGVGLNDEIKKLNISSGENVSFTLFPNINTPLGRLKYTSSVNKRLKQVVAESDAVIVRAVSDLGWLAYKHAKCMDKPIAMEMAACAWDSTWHHGNRLGKIYAPIRYIRDRIIAKNADYVMYVSQEFLQRRYPTNAQTETASNVFIKNPRKDKIDQRLSAIKTKEEILTKPNVIGLVGNLDNKIKGVADALTALSIVEKQKPGCFTFRHLGPGNQKPYKKLAKKLGIAEHVHFDGMIQSGQAVLDWMEQLDLYLQPSYQEGVPRATIEAMSTACPIVASTAGGIPELIEEKWLIKPGDTHMLAALIMKILDSPNNQYEAGLYNYNKSLDFIDTKLSAKREKFWGAFAAFADGQNKIKQNQT